MSIILFRVRSKLADAYYAKSYALNEVKVDLNTVDAADEAIRADDFYRFITTRGTVYLKKMKKDETSFNVGFTVICRGVINISLQSGILIK